MPSRLYFAFCRITVVLTAFMACCGSAVVGQTPALKERDSDSREVVLDIIASPALQDVASVLVTDNGSRVPMDRLRLLTATSANNSPAQLVFVLDAVNSGLQDLARSEDAREAILKANTGPLAQLTSMVILSDTPGHATSSSSAPETASLHQHQLFAHRLPASHDATALSEQLRSYEVGLHRILQAQGALGQAESSAVLGSAQLHRES